MRIMAVGVLLVLATAAPGQDMRLSQILIPGEGWHEVKCDDLGNLLPRQTEPAGPTRGPVGAAVALGLLLGLAGLTVSGAGRSVERQKCPPVRQPALARPARRANIRLFYGAWQVNACWSACGYIAV